MPRSLRMAALLLFIHALLESPCFIYTLLTRIRLPLAPKMQHARKSDHVTSMFKSLWWSSLAYKRLHLTSWVYKALYNPILMEKIRLTCRYWHMFSNHSWQHILFLQYEGLFMFLLFMPLLLPKFPPPSTTSLLNSYRLLIFPKFLWAEFVDPSSGSPKHFF